MKKIWKIGLSFVLTFYWTRSPIVYASFGGGHGGGGHGGGHGSGTGSISFPMILLFGLGIGLCRYLYNKWQEKRSAKIEKSIKFNQRYKKNLKKLFVDFQEAWTAGNLDTVKNQMSFSLYDDNQKLLKKYAKKGMEPRTVDVFIQNVHILSKKGKIMTLRYEVYARDYFVNQNSKKIVNKWGSVRKSQRKPDKVRFTEDWMIEVESPTKFVVFSVNRK